MKSILEVIILLLLSFLIGSNKSVDTACSLPDTSQWSVANSDICLKVNGDSIFWTMKSDKKVFLLSRHLPDTICLLPEESV